MLNIIATFAWVGFALKNSASQDTDLIQWVFFTSMLVAIWT